MEVLTAGTSLVDNNMTNITASTTGTTDDMNTQGMEDNPLDPGIFHESAFPGTISSIQQPAEGFKDDLSKQVRIHQEDSSWVDKRMVINGSNTSVMLKSASTIYTFIMNCFSVYSILA